MTVDELTRVDVALKERGYPVFIGNGFLNGIGAMMKPYLRSNKVFVITDTQVEKLYLQTVRDSMVSAGLKVETLSVPAGESSKSLEQAARLIDAILKLGCDRHCAVVSLGGGVVGDLAGFCASILLRGIDFIQIPTTLLAQTDSSVGGKTAVDTPAGKNLIGTFHQPKAVFIDVRTLKTLDKRQVFAGFAEVAKYGVALDAGFWQWLRENGESVLALDERACVYAVEQSCRIKAGVVSADEFEETGLRALLNFGHTFGHAIEAATGMRVLHGEGVAVGSVLAAWLSVQAGLCAEAVAREVADVYERWGLPVRYENLETSELLGYMRKDKKAMDARLNFVLLKGIGRAELVRDVAASDVEKVLIQKGLEKNG